MWLVFYSSYLSWIHPETSSRQQRIHNAFGASWRNPVYIQYLESTSKWKAGILDEGLFVGGFWICLVWKDLEGFVFDFCSLLWICGGFF